MFVMKLTAECHSWPDLCPSSDDERWRLLLMISRLPFPGQPVSYCIYRAQCYSPIYIDRAAREGGREGGRGKSNILCFLEANASSDCLVTQSVQYLGLWWGWASVRYGGVKMLGPRQPDMYMVDWWSLLSRHSPLQTVCVQRLFAQHKCPHTPCLSLGFSNPEICYLGSIKSKHNYY